MATYNGTDGDDTYTGTDAADTIMGYAGRDVLSGGSGSDIIDGGAGDDVLAGDLGGDTLYGGVGRNTLMGGAGDDRIYSADGAIDDVDGGADFDRWYGDFSSSVTPVVFDAAAGTVSNGTQLDNIEAVTLVTGYGADRFRVNFNDFDIDGGGGEDTIVIDLSAITQPLGYKNIAQFGSDVNGVTGDEIGRYSTFSSMEHVTYIGTGVNDTVVVNTSGFNTENTLAIDAGAGFDTLQINLVGSQSKTFVQADDGTVSTDFGTLAGFEKYKLTITGGDNRIVTGAGDDIVVVTPNGSDQKTNSISAGAGSDQITVEGGVATVVAGSGDDTVTVSDAGFTADGGDGEDSLTLIFRAATVFRQDSGFSDGSSYTGFEHVVINAAGGRDVNNDFYLTSSRTDLTIDAGSSARNDADALYVDLSAEMTGVTFTLQGTRVTFGRVNVTQIEQVEIVGTQGDDILDEAIGYAEAKSFDGGAGNDLVRASVSLGAIELSVAEDGSITSSSGHFANVERFALDLYAAGNTVALGNYDDTIVAHRGGDLLSGGGGNDTIILTAAATAGTLNGGDGDDTLTGGGGADTLVGDDGADKIVGGDSADKLSGGEGNDLLQGGLGDDVLAGGNGDDILDGQDGIDTAGYGGALAGVFVTLATSAQQNTRGAGLDLLVSIENVLGSAFADRLTGNGNANLLDGRAGNDLLKGGAGDDQLIGGAGVDRLTGGGGADRFVFADGDFAAKGRDTILDFSHADGDRIDLSAIDANTTVKGDQTFTFIGTAAFGGSGASELRVVDQTGDKMLLQGDTNHDGKADFTILIHADAPLIAADFVL